MFRSSFESLVFFTRFFVGALAAVLAADEVPALRVLVEGRLPVRVVELLLARLVVAFDPDLLGFFATGEVLRSRTKRFLVRQLTQVTNKQAAHRRLNRVSI